MRHIQTSDVLIALIVSGLSWVAASAAAARDEPGHPTASYESAMPMTHPSAEVVVRGFLETVRAGADPDAAGRYMADVVTAHQVLSEQVMVVRRTPAQYADHVREFLAAYGDYDFQITEFIASGDRVYARWRQEGRHLQSMAGEPVTGKPLIDISSAVYRVQDGKIVEYWIQTDRKGMELQLDALK